MLINSSKVIDQFTSEGAEFEKLVNLLVRSCSRTVGIPSDKIYWDHRTYVPDGGKDLVVNAEHNCLNCFVPRQKSLWSIKSGKDGKNPSKFKSEVKDHPKVINWLVNGGVYVWCAVHDSTTDERFEVEAAVPSLLEELNQSSHNSVQSSQFIFRWNDAITEELNRHIAVCATFFPQHVSNLQFLATLQEWKNDDPDAPNWKPFGSRDLVVSKVIAHLLGNSSPNALHVCGLSGIGKSRTVRRACEVIAEDHEILVLYVDDYSRIEGNRNFERLFSGMEQNILLVIDEVGEEDAIVIQRKFRDCLDRVRLVTIGTAKRQEERLIASKIVLKEPKDATEILAVISDYANGLPSELIKNISEKCHFDLRMAIMLVDASRRDPSDWQTPLRGLETIWRRILKGHGLSLRDEQLLEKAYIAASTFLDVGWNGDYRQELSAIEEFFGIDENDLLSAINIATQIGLGIKTKHFFETVPRALSGMMFTERSWPQIENRLEEFFTNLSSRLQRRFLQKCHDCGDDIRSEVKTKLGDYFRKSLARKDIALFNEHSKILGAWIEFDPSTGLQWLRNTVEKTPLADLTVANHSPISIHAYARSEIVWLCESLSRFPSYFEDCEAILFKLATNETEPDIGNNSTEAWSGLFWITLHVHSLPFEQRVRYLFSRFDTNDVRHLRMAIDSAFAVLKNRLYGNPIPPDFVGGVLAPEPVYPKSQADFLRLQHAFAQELLNKVNKIQTAELLLHSATLILNNLVSFIDLGLISEVAAILKCQESLHLKTISSIDEILAVENHLMDPGDVNRHKLRAWRQSLSGDSLSARARILTSQNQWDVSDVDGLSPFDALGQELIHEPEVLIDLSNWLGNPEALSSMALGVAIGRLNLTQELNELFLKWVLRGEAKPFTTGVLVGIAAKAGRLSDTWAATLDLVLESDANYVVEATHFADVGERGFTRLMKCFEQGFRPTSKLCSYFGFGHWLQLLSIDRKLQILYVLRIGGEEGEPQAPSVALDLLAMFAFKNGNSLPKELAEVSLYFVRSSLMYRRIREGHKWTRIAELTVPYFPKEMCSLAIDALTGFIPESRPTFRDFVSVIAGASKHAPDVVLELIGGAWLDKKRRASLQVHVLPGVMEAIGVSRLAKWLEQNGNEHLAAIARHLESPYLGENGEVILPPVTAWLFVEHSSNDDAFHSFCLGRGAAVGWRNKQECYNVKANMATFLSHEIKRIRDWANYEIRSAKNLTTWLEEREEEDERT